MIKLPDGIPTPEEARNNLLQRYVELPLGSYHRWLHKEWFPKYKEVLVQKDGMWIPSLDKLKELQALDETYEAYKLQKERQQYAKKMEEKELEAAYGKKDDRDNTQQQTS